MNRSVENDSKGVITVRSENDFGMIMLKSENDSDMITVTVETSEEEALGGNNLNLSMLLAATEFAQELDALVQESPLKDELQPAISAACDEIDAAVAALELTPEYACFIDRVNDLSAVLGEVLQKMENN